jgi:hypothetical protein
MEGPLVLGIIGAALVFAAALVSLAVVRADSPRYKLDLLDTWDGGAQVKRMVQDIGRINAVIMLGAALQLAAILWQATS